MTLHNKAAFARLAGVTPTAINHVLRTGSLVPTADGKIDDEHRLSLAYLERRRRASPGSGQDGTGRPVDGGAGAPLRDTDDDDERGTGTAPRSLAEQKLALDIKIRRERLKHDKLFNLKELGAMVTLESCERAYATIASALESNFRSFADRHADELVAMVTAGAGRIQVAELLDVAIDTAMQRVVATVHRTIDEMRPLDEHIADTPELRWLARLLCPKCGGKITKGERASLTRGRDGTPGERSARTATPPTHEANVIT